MVEQDTATGDQGEGGRSHEQATAGEPKRDLGWQLERLWDEIKQITRQIEKETRRSGRIARLRFELRGLRRDVNEQCARLGQLVYEAQKNSDKRPTLARVEGYDERVVRIGELETQIEAKEAQIDELRAQGEPDTEAA